EYWLTPASHADLSRGAFERCPGPVALLQGCTGEANWTGHRRFLGGAWCADDSALRTSRPLREGIDEEHAIRGEKRRQKQPSSSCIPPASGIAPRLHTAPPRANKFSNV